MRGLSEAVFWLCLFASFWLCSGEPDLIDAIIFHLMEGGA